MLKVKESAVQRRFGPGLFFAVIVFVFLIQILAIDMYVPALPEMQREFGISAAYLNITVFVFLVAQAVAMVAAGPLSDRFGRRSVYIVGCGLFFAGSAACAFTPSVEGLFAARAIEALGLGCTATLSTALVKDAYEGEDLKLTMTLLQSLVIIGPVLAPFLGSLMVEWLGWRAIFLCSFDLWRGHGRARASDR